MIKIWHTSSEAIQQLAVAAGFEIRISKYSGLFPSNKYEIFCTDDEEAELYDWASGLSEHQSSGYRA